MYLLDIAHWTLLLALKEQGSLSAAAMTLGITQSAATQRLQEAERRLGVLLARREGRTLALTDAGKIIALAAAETQHALLQAESDAIWQGKRNSRRLRVAVSQFDPPNLSMRLIDICQKTVPDLSAEIVRISSDAVVAAIMENTADLALIPGKSASPAIAGRAIFSDRLVAVFPKGKYVAETSFVQPEDFAGKSFLTYDLRPEPGWEYDSFFNRGRSFPGNAVKIESTDLICRLVSQGAGASILPALCVSLSDHADRLWVAELDCEPIRFDWHMLHTDAIPEHLLNRIAENVEKWSLEY